MNFKHVGCDIDYDLATETINGKRFYVTQAETNIRL